MRKKNLNPSPAQECWLKQRGILIKLLALMMSLALFAACAKRALPEEKVRGFAKFALNGGAAISQANSDEYSPYVIQMGDNYLVLVFGSNRSCGGCSGHNLFIAKSVSAYNNNSVFPAFNSPTVMTVASTPLNYSARINFAVTAAGNNVRIHLTNAGGTVQVTPNIAPDGPYDTTLATIANASGQTGTVIGYSNGDDKIISRQGSTINAYSRLAAYPLTAIPDAGSATTIAAVDSTFTSRYDGFFTLAGGQITSMSYYGSGGKISAVNTAIAKSKITPQSMTLMQGGGTTGPLMFISGTEAGGTSEDLFVVDGLTVWQMWQDLEPKPPGAPAGGGGGGGAVSDPTFTPAAGSYAMPISVQLSTATSGAIICYTSDGITTPVCSATPACTTGTQYASAVSVTYTTTKFKAIACKTGLTDSAVVNATHVSDGTQPTTPGAPNADGTSSSQIQVFWTASTDNTTATAQLVYEICQTTVNNGCNTFTATFTTSAGVTSYNSNGLSPSTTYYYRIRSKDLAGNTSGYSAQFNGVTLP